MHVRTGPGASRCARGFRATKESQPWEGIWEGIWEGVWEGVWVRGRGSANAREGLISTHTHACKAGLADTSVVKQSSIQCHMPQNASISVQVSPPLPQVGHRIPPCGVPVIASPSF